MDTGEHVPKCGKESARVVDSIKSTPHHAPTIHLNSLSFPIKSYKKVSNKFKTSKVIDLGNLARRAYDPE